MAAAVVAADVASFFGSSYYMADVDVAARSLMNLQQHPHPQDDDLHHSYS